MAGAAGKFTEGFFGISETDVCRTGKVQRQVEVLISTVQVQTECHHRIFCLIEFTVFGSDLTVIVGIDILQVAPFKFQAERISVLTGIFIHPGLCLFVRLEETVCSVHEPGIDRRTDLTHEVAVRHTVNTSQVFYLILVIGKVADNAELPVTPLVTVAQLHFDTSVTHGTYIIFISTQRKFRRYRNFHDDIGCLAIVVIESKADLIIDHCIYPDTPCR